MRWSCTGGGKNDKGSESGAFLDTGGSFTAFNVPGNPGGIEATGINDRGQMVGRFNSPVSHGFVYTGGSFTTFGVPGGHQVTASGINDRGQIVGDFVDADYVPHIFVDSGGSFSTFDAPGGVFVGLHEGINDRGQIVGTGGDYAFLATPVSSVPEPASSALLAAGVIGAGVLCRRRGL